MAINIQNLIDAVNAKYAAMDSATPIGEITKLITAKEEIDASIGVLSYNGLNTLPTADSANAGNIVFIEDTKLTDKLGTFYFSSGSEWRKLNISADSDEDQVSFRTEFPGRIAGYTAGGFPSPSGAIAQVYKYSFTVDTDVSHVSNLSAARYEAAQITSINVGYVAGGTTSPVVSAIDKFPFATETASALSITLNAATTAVGYSSFNDGYYIRSPGGIMDKFPFALEDAATTIGTSPAGLWFKNHGSNTSWPYNTGWQTGGYPDKTLFNKFPFSSELNLTSIGTLTSARGQLASQSSNTYGYMSGGRGPLSPVGITLIEKFAFANESIWSNVGDLVSGSYLVGGVSSETNGYYIGGTPPAQVAVYQKFPFEADNNATQLSDLAFDIRYNGPTGFQQ